jgi:signal transduction histidine kinase/CheY-like chemotaxis protein
MSELLAALGYAVFERVGEGSFRLEGEAPDWIDSFREHDPGATLVEMFPFLEVFLPDAEAFWDFPGRRTTLRSDFWTQGDQHLCATATIRGGPRLLIESADQRFHETRELVHYAHETALAYDEIAKLSRALERATQAKSEFLARMSHEIRTPMNALLGMAELLWETSLGADQREYVRIFRRAGDNLLAVINDILDFSKVEAGQVELENVDFTMEDVIKEAADVSGVKTRSKGLTLNYVISPEVPKRLTGDPGRLRQVLLNLLGNATKFTEQGGLTIAVEPTRQHGMLHFKVSDTGIGIPADRIATIFESFSQADASTTRKYGGTGLGLSISKRFVELMRGEIWAESVLGEGSTMHFTARFGIPDQNVPVEATPPVATSLPSGHMRILLADDSEDNRFLIRGYLKGADYTIDEAENGLIAVQKFKKSAYDLVLTDAEMPEMDGYQATREIRAYEAAQGLAPTPVLALTAHAMKEARDRSLEAGCTDHLTKPIKKATLIAAIAQYGGAGSSLPVESDRLKPVPLKVTVEPWLKSVAPGYLEKRRNDVPALRTALDHCDFATVRTLGHQMSGTGAGYGFDGITEIGAALERAALASDVPAMKTQVDALESYLRNVELE